MRKAKLIFSVIMAAMMICVSVVPAFAEETGDPESKMYELKSYYYECAVECGLESPEPGEAYLQYTTSSIKNLESVVVEVGEFIKNSRNVDVTEEEIDEQMRKLKEADESLCVDISELIFLTEFCSDETNADNYYSEDVWKDFSACIEYARQQLGASTDEVNVDTAYWNLLLSYNRLCISNQTYGDVDGDGDLSIKDAAELQLYLAQFTSFNSSQRIVAAVKNSCENLNITDAAAIQLYKAKLYDGELNCYELKKMTDNIDVKDWKMNPLYKKAKFYREFPDLSEQKTEFSSGTVNLMENITKSEPEGISDSYDYEKFNSFAIDLIRYNMNYNENITASPASAIYALGMAANGANGKTNEEMLSLFNVNSNEELNKCLYQFMVKNCGENSGVNIANSMWINKGTAFEANEEFLQTNADYYNSDVFSALFNDDTVKDVNKWVSDNTDGRIPELMDEIDSDTAMLLINTVLFDAEWSRPFDVSYSGDGIFNNADGTRSIVKMMSSGDEWYIEDDDTTGFRKAYDNGYEFVALLPQAGVSIEEYLDALTPEKLSNLFSQSNSETAEVVLPAFKINNEIKLKEPLKTMGMIDAFDSVDADFSRMGTSPEGKLYIGGIKQKAEIAVDEMGTKASAATEIEISVGSAQPTIKKSVICDRPFLYFIIDKDTKMPLFAGAYVNGEK